MTRDGRPLRFLALVLGSWVGVRATMLWPSAPAAVAREALLSDAVAAPRTFTAPVAVAPAPQSAVEVPPRTEPAPSHGLAAAVAPRSIPSWTIDDLGIVVEPDSARAASPGLVAGLPPILRLPEPPDRSRFFGSAWAVARGGSGPPGGVPGVQLGGSQAGVRLGYALSADRRLALVGRAASPLGHGMREIALGVEWQPTRLPVRVVAEQRVALGAGRGGPTLAAVGGVGPLPLAAGFQLEAYGQGGVIARDGAEAFADGALRVARPIATPGGVKLDLGGGAWGAAQRGARRVDVGPSLSAVVPLGPQPVRLSLDWRQRVAGNAAPGSGLVVTIGADF